MTVSGAHLDELRNLLAEPGKSLRTQNDLDGLDPGIDKDNLACRVLLRPGSTVEIQKIVSFCARHRIGIVPQGGRTGLSMGAVSQPGQIIIDTSRLQDIERIDPVSATAICAAGVSLEKLEHAANAEGLSVGIDLSARGSATIGGMVSTNAGGIEAFRNGVTRHRILGLEAVLPDGQLLNDIKRVTKANEGYDISQLLTGAEGTLGIITKVALSLLPVEHARQTALVSFASVRGAIEIFTRLRNSPHGRVLSAELMLPSYTRQAARQLDAANTIAFESDPDATFAIYDVAEMDGRGLEWLEQQLSTAIDDGCARNAVFAKNSVEASEIWRLREESFAAEASYAHQLWYDVSVPLDAIETYLEIIHARISELDPGLQLFIIGHIGDGNLHSTVASNDSLEKLAEDISAIHYDPLNQLGGSFSAEHGIGLEKLKQLAHYGDEGKLASMRKIKQVLDPSGIMNPGKIFS